MIWSGAIWEAREVRQGRRGAWTLLWLVAMAVLLGAGAGCGPGPGALPGWSAPYSTAKLAERHCYRTLAEVDCHADPLPGEANRKVGFFDAPLTR